MANPGYPPMGGQMQPMGPMGAMGMPRQPVRQGTSHMVPIVVSAGLAVGVFCGLLFGLGTGKHEAELQKVSNGVKAHDDVQVPDLPSPSTIKPIKPPPPRAGSNAGSAVAATAGSAAPAGATGSAAPETKPGKLTIEIKPDSAAQAAKILVDGKPITGTKIDIPFDPGVAKKTVKVLVQAPGYKDVEREVDVESDGSTSISFELGKGGGRPAATAGGTPTGDSSGGNSGGNNAGNSGGNNSGNSGAGKGSSGKGKGSGGKGKGSGLIDI